MLNVKHITAFPFLPYRTVWSWSWGHMCWFPVGFATRR